MSDEAAERAAQTFLEGLLEVLGERAEVQVLHRGDRELSMNLQGVATFDGVDQRTLRALGYLTEIAVRRRVGQGLRVHLDVNGYRRRRVEELTQLALSRAEEVTRTGEAVRLEPMESFERKAIHEALADVAGVRTHSEGRGPERRVIIEPAEPH